MNKKSSKRTETGLTARELMERLEADPEWVARRDRKEAQRKAEEAELTRIEAPLAADLRTVGYDVDGAWDLVNTSTPYPDALPILLEHLQRDYPPVLRVSCPS